jgi:hypothetical protein
VVASLTASTSNNLCHDMKPTHTTYSQHGNRNWARVKVGGVDVSTTCAWLPYLTYRTFDIDLKSEILNHSTCTWGGGGVLPVPKPVVKDKKGIKGEIQTLT